MTRKQVITTAVKWWCNKIRNDSITDTQLWIFEETLRNTLWVEYGLWLCERHWEDIYIGCNGDLSFILQNAAKTAGIPLSVFPKFTWMYILKDSIRVCNETGKSVYLEPIEEE